MSSMSSAAFEPPPFPMRGPMSIGTDCRSLAFERGTTSCVRARRDLLHATLRSQSVHVFGRLFASVALVPHYRRFCVRAGCVPCVRAKRFLRASEVRLLTCERDLISFARTLNLKGHSVARTPHYVARNICCVDVRTFPCHQRFDGRGSRFSR